MKTFDLGILGLVSSAFLSSWLLMIICTIILINEFIQDSKLYWSGKWKIQNKQEGEN